MTPRKWPVFCGYVEEDLKQNNQSTTHIDAEAGTGGMLRVLSLNFDHVITWHLERRENTGTCLQCVWKRANSTFKTTLLVIKLNPHNLCSLQNPSQVRFQNMCHFHGWPQQKYYRSWRAWYCTTIQKKHSSWLKGVPDPTTAQGKTLSFF